VSRGPCLPLSLPATLVKSGDGSVQPFPDWAGVPLALCCQLSHLSMISSAIRHRDELRRLSPVARLPDLPSISRSSSVRDLHWAGVYIIFLDWKRISDELIQICIEFGVYTKKFCGRGFGRSEAKIP
jgi:hypothetical protein